MTPPAPDSSDTHDAWTGKTPTSPPRYRRETLEALLESAAQGVVAVDEQGQVLLVNSMTERLFGYPRDELVGGPLEKLIPTAHRGGHHHHMADYFADPRQRAMGVGQELMAERRDGTKFPVEIALSFTRSDSGVIALAMITDTTERRRAEAQREQLQEQLLQAQKMESLAVMAGGIAHDFNNVLSIISSFTAAAKLRTGGDERLSGYLDQTLVAVDRAARLIRQLLAYSRPGGNGVEAWPVDIAAAVNDSLDLLAASAPPGVSVRRAAPTDAGAVLANPSQLQQVVMNLGSNALQALAPVGGELSVDLTTLDLTEGSSRERFGLPDGPYVLLIISDNGPGIPEDVRDRVFEPYFTTKPAGEGTGLGLSVVKGVVETLGGVIDMHSTTGEGTRFAIYLPRIDGANTSEEAVGRKGVPSGEGTVMLVDDEPAIVAATQLLLEQLGYDVVGFTSSVEAVGAFAREPDKFEAVLTDLTMPRLTGLELTLKIRAVRPGTPVVLTTGFRGLVDEQTLEMMKIDQVLLKPCNVQDLAEAMHAATTGRG